MTENQRTAAHWDRVLTTGDNSFSPEVYWMAVPEVHKRIQRLSTGGALTAKGVPYDVWFQYCVFEFLAARLPVERMLSVGCGTGDLERNLALYNCFKHMDACDISPAAIAVARQKAVEMEIHNITFIASDIAKFPLPAEHYDVVWFNSSLHHIKDLEGTCAAIARTLKPDGFVFLNEYVGPSRFRLPARQKDAIRAAFDLLPRRFKRSSVPPRHVRAWTNARALLRQRSLAPAPTEYYATAPYIPQPTLLALLDPSEAVRSADILRVLADHFQIVRKHDIGGSVLHFLLSGIAGNFVKDDPQTQGMLSMLFQIEDTLIAAGDLQSDFAVVVAQKRA